MKKYLSLVFGFMMIACFAGGMSSSVSAIAKESTLTVNVRDKDQVVELMPGSFGKSNNTTVEISTDNYSGYSYFIASAGSSTSLVNGNNDEIESISGNITESVFSSDDTYYNKWGFKPSQYVTTSGGVDTVVANSDYLPSPSTTGLLIAKTNVANSTADVFTHSFAAKVNNELPAGTYTHENVVMVVANAITFNITYDDSTTDTAASMPSPNPQPVSIDAGTPAAESYATLSSAVPTLPDMTFDGWCDETPILNTTTGNYECSGTTYQPGGQYGIDQTADGANITLYAIWLSDTFPTVWSQMGKCIFDGKEDDANPGYISGSECQEYINDRFIDTGIALYSTTNYSKDYEVHFTVDRYVYNEQPDSQSTLFNDKLSSSATDSPYGGKSPGIVIRKASTSNSFEIKSTYTTAPHAVERYVVKTGTTGFTGTDVRVFRINGIIYTSIDNEPLIELQDITTFNQQFGLTAWFGAYPDNVNCTEDCTAAKRYFEGELSNMYIKLGDLDENNLHEVIFNGNNGTPASTPYLVMDGDSIATFPTVTRTDWIFGGWWTATTGGTEVTAPLTPTADTLLYARWYKAVSDAEITNSSIGLSVNDTETIQITNGPDLEPYTLVSNDTSVATVDQSTGVVTAVGNGMTTITMTGTLTGDTKTINVTVGTTITVTFDPDFDSEATFTRTVAEGGSFNPLPDYSRSGYELEGWYTGQDGTGTKLTTSTVFGGSTPTTYFANWEAATYVCKAATTLHTEPCSKTNNSGCRAAGYAYDETITYGSLVQSGATALIPGNAMTCDINTDGTFDETDERFYYYATNADDHAELIYYKNISNAENSYSDGLALLPTASTTGWTNPGLVVYDSTLLNGDYDGKVARFMSYDETVAACDNSTSNFGTNGKCLYILEQSNFAYTDIRDGYWIGRSDHSTRVHTSSRNITSNSKLNGVRPVIEVPLNLISLDVATSTYDITFDPHNETAAWTETIDAGDDLTDVYPATDPTYTNHLFQGWYTAASGGNQISSSTEPSGDTTYHAQWLGTVALATFDSNSISVEEGNTATITVTNSADIENYSFASLDSTVATVDASTGVVTGVAEGTTSIRMTGATSLTFVDIPVTVTAPTAMVCELAEAGTLHTATRASGSVALTYGQIANSATPQPGDAYNCDVDYDGTYSAANERFYYLTQDGDGNAVLFAWNNYMRDTSDSSDVGHWGTGASAENISYADAINTLPSNASGAWDNPGLIEQANSKAARLNKVAEMTTACGVAVNAGTNPMDTCDYMMENTGYDGGGRSAYWVLNEGSSLRFHSNSHKVISADSNATSAVRPAIVVPDNLIEKYVPQVLDVTNAVIANSDLTVPVGGNITIQVSNSASLEPYTFSSDDSTIATVDSSTGVVTGVSAGTVDIIMTGTNSGLTKTLEVDVLSSVPDRTVTFNTNGGTLDNGAPSTRTVSDGSAVGALPTASKTNYRFFGWYTDDGTFYEEVYPEEIIDSNITFYARWIEDTSSFPIQFAEINECQFDVSSHISGTYCLEDDYSGNLIDQALSYIDTGIALYDTAAKKNNDYEIGFTIKEYNYTPNNTNVSQITLMSAKRENDAQKWPGLAVRRFNTGTKLEFTHSKNVGTKATNSSTETATVHHVKVVRESGVIKFSVNDGSLTMLQDVTDMNDVFPQTVWFGASAKEDGTPQRQFTGKLTDMYVRVGVNSTYSVELDSNGGTLPSGAQANYTIAVGDPVGTLPTPTAPSANYTFGGWYDGNTLVSDGTQYIPTGDVTLVAEWVYNSSDTPVVFDVSNDATRGYKTIINNWVGSPVNITTFNEDTTTINNSTWGDTSELPEAQFWTTLKNNFETNNCMKPSYSDAATTTPNPTAWTNGSMDCSKPDEYDTLIGSALNVYLYNNQTLGAQVTYAEADDGVIRNLIPGNTYKWVKDGDSTVYGYVTVTSNGSDHGTRWVDTGQIRNTRDLGGLPADTDDDGTVDAYVDYGRLFRGEKLWNESASELTNLGINKEYDVGNPSEYAGNTQLSDYQNDEVIHYNFDYNSGDENNASSNYMRAWNAVTDIMTDIAYNSKNIYFHCRVGADRTGTVAYLLEGLLGVPDEERYQEYELTHLSGLFDRTRYYKQKTSSNNLKFVFMMGYVQTTQDIIDWYMHNPKADSNLIDDFRAAMTTPIQSQQQQQQSSAQQNSSLQQAQSLMNSSATSDANGSSSTGDTNNTGATTSNETEGDASASKMEPLGVYEETSESNSNAAGLAIAAAVIATAGGLTYANANNNNKED